ncbi:MAG: hypothetical protein A2007_03435 [Verrucomicrobia bacterium GWC2_42_7]|nr:MAG: hypothetical protein A2007_03435 [Verrucomicrobia bacterium GWC2_42_7]
MKLAHYEKPEHRAISPVNEIEKLFQSFLNPFEHFFGRTRTEQRIPATYYSEDTDNFYVKIELPGIKKEEVTVECDNSILSVSAKSKKHNKSESEESESSYTFFRSIRLPDSIHEEKVAANLEDGLLTVTLPKSEKKKRRQIMIGG